MEFDNQTNSMVELVREMRIVRLGEGVDKTKRFSEKALERTLAALKEYAQIINENKVEKLRFVATSATRDATNREDFFSLVRSNLNVEAEVITGEEEAALSFAGATKSLARRFPAPYLVIDLGGGSTELVVGVDKPDSAYSMNVGCVRMTERHSPGGNPSIEQESAIRSDVAQEFKQAAKQVDFSKVKSVIGVAGTVTTVAAHALGIKKYDPNILHGALITKEQISVAVRDFANLTYEQRAALGYMHPGRVEVITAGAIVLDQVMKEVKAEALIASERDILDGVAWSLVS
ncbi:MAG: exopolyphosphatase [Candidatus Nanopelagicales bacterium]